MSRQCQLLEQTTQAAYRKSAIAAFVTLCVSLVLVFKAPDLWAILIPEFGRLLQYFEINVHLQAISVLRFQMEVFQNVASHMLAKVELASLDIGPRQIPFEMKIKNVLMVTAVDISVIVPTLNEERYLSACLESLRSQAFDQDYEVIVVDGGSTDRTLYVAERFADRVVSNAKSPVGAARNEGARLANGGVVAFIDADTIASQFWLSSIERSFKDRSVVGATGPTLPFDGTPIDSITYSVWTLYFQKFLLAMGMPHVIGFNCAYRTKPFLRVGGFDEKRVTSEDIKLAQKMRRFGKIKFEKTMSALTSARRFRKYGAVYIGTLYLLNGISTLLFDRSFKNYPPVR